MTLDEKLRSTKKTSSRKTVFAQMIQARPHLMISILAGIAAYFCLPLILATEFATHIIISWNIGVVLYLILTIKMMLTSSQATMKSRAQTQDEGKFIILILVILAVVFGLGSIAAELTAVKELQGLDRYCRVGLAVFTIFTSWFFTHIIFALHYAHDFYGNGAKGLVFPEDENPDYLDFLYFSCIIGTSAQTADVNFSSKSLRRTGLIHSVFSFFFNTTILALTINIASGLF